MARLVILDTTSALNQPPPSTYIPPNSWHFSSCPTSSATTHTMTLTLDTNPRYGQLNFDPSYTSSASPPQFSDPWAAAPAPSAGNNIYVPGSNSHHQHHHPHHHPHHQGLSPEMGLNLARQHAARQSTSSVSSSASYGSMPVTTTSTGKLPRRRTFGLFQQC